MTRSTSAPGATRAAGAPTSSPAAAEERHQGFDVVSGLTVYITLLFALPSRLSFAPLGGAGNPAALVGLGLGCWWLFDRIQRPEDRVRVPRPVRRACLCVVFCILVSFVVAMTRAIDATEISTADLGLMTFFAWSALLIAAEDGVGSQSRLDTLLRRLVFGASLVAALGLIQFVTGQSWIDRVHIPGLVANQSFGGVNQRGGFNRPGGTALHAIEFGSVMTMLLPMAITLGLTDRHRPALRRWLPVAVMSLAILLSISKSAIICGIVGLLVVGWRWPGPVRRRALAGIVGLGGFVFMAVPGMLGTLLGMFTTAGEDGSTLSRVDSYATAGRFIARSPVFGRGLSTFLPSYRILDNQYLVLLIELGVVGTAVFLGLMLTGIWAAVRARALTADPAVRQRAQALAAGVSAGATGLAFYDGFAFPMASGLLFLLLGLAGAQLRLIREARADPSAPRPPAPERSAGSLI